MAFERASTFSGLKQKTWILKLNVISDLFREVGVFYTTSERKCINACACGTPAVLVGQADPAGRTPRVFHTDGLCFMTCFNKME